MESYSCFVEVKVKRKHRWYEVHYVGYWQRVIQQMTHGHFSYKSGDREHYAAFLWLTGKESGLLCRRHGFSPNRKILEEEVRQTTPLFLFGESHIVRILVGLQSMGL